MTVFRVEVFLIKFIIDKKQNGIYGRCFVLLGSIIMNELLP